MVSWREKGKGRGERKGGRGKGGGGRGKGKGRGKLGKINNINSLLSFLLLPFNSLPPLPIQFIFFEINGLTFTDINLQNSPQETLVARTGENWKIKNITITNPYGGAKNLDCIDVGGSNIVIKHCTLNCGDDNVAMKLDATNVIVEV